MGGTELMIAQMALSGASMIAQNQQARAQARQQDYQRQLQRLKEERERAIRKRQMKQELLGSQASARARFGAMGIGSGAGSSQAILSGLQKKYDQALKDQEYLDDLKQKSEDSAYAFGRKADLLNRNFTNMNNLLGFGSDFVTLSKKFPSKTVGGGGG